MRNSVSDPQALLTSLCAYPAETEWLEFKENQFHEEEVGRYVSALANSAMLSNEECAYLIFGVRDGDHEVVGSTVKLKEKKVGNEPFENWLTRGLEPRLNLDFVDTEVEGKPVSILRIDPAYVRPVAFKGVEYIRIGSVTKMLREYPERARSLWDATSRYSFEQGIAAGHQTAEDILSNFRCADLFTLWGRSPRSTREAIDLLVGAELIVDDKQNRFDVTNLLVLLTSGDLATFPMLAAKAPRFIIYEGTSKITAKKDIPGKLGYAAAFQRLLKFIMGELPQKEVMRGGLRTVEYAYPEIAIRELVANAMIHQDLSDRSSGPLLELFSDRLQITNPGLSMVPLERIIDAPSRSRNPRLAKMMRELKLCEQRGSGVDRAIESIEANLLPPPLFASVSNSTVVTLFAERPFAAMTVDERLRACYQHACLRHQANDFMSNGSLRIRFGMQARQYPQVSTVISSAIEAGLICPAEEDQGNRNARYVPIWAKVDPRVM